MKARTIAPNASDDLAKLPHGPGAGPSVATLTPARAAPVQSIAQSTQLGDDPKVDAEFDRFEQVAEPMPGGGWYCPVYGEPEMPRGISGADWDAFIADCGTWARQSLRWRDNAPRGKEGKHEDRTHQQAVLNFELAPEVKCS